MNHSLIALSVLLNFLFFFVGWVLVQRKGGIPFLIRLFSQLRSSNFSPSAYQSPYYLHRNSQLQQLPIAPTDVVLLGDSITDEGEWAELLPFASVKNRGISADTTKGLLDRLQPILESKPNVILLMIGINDLLNDQKSPEQVGSNYEKILTQIQQSTPNTVVLVQSVLPVNERLYGKKCDREIMQLNQLIKTLAASLGYQYVDLFPHFADPNNQLDEQYTEDGVHLNGKGYQTWAKILTPYLRDLGVISQNSEKSDF